MSRHKAHFEHLYTRQTDPWNYETSPYEAAKYRATLDALMQPRYLSALEAGCSIGVLSAILAPRCDCLLALDLSDKAVKHAAARLMAYKGACARRAMLPRDWPKGRYDLIVFSEFLYYLTAPEIAAVAALTARDAVAGAECVLVHYQGNTQTDLMAHEALDLFCTGLTRLRPLQQVDHVTRACYSHRTVILP